MDQAERHLEEPGEPMHLAAPGAGAGGVIGRVVGRGARPHGLLRYLFGPGRSNEHVSPSLVAAWGGDPAALEPRHFRLATRPPPSILTTIELGGPARRQGLGRGRGASNRTKRTAPFTRSAATSMASSLAPSRATASSSHSSQSSYAWCATSCRTYSLRGGKPALNSFSILP
jgi:hypothetical protein